MHEALTALLAALRPRRLDPQDGREDQAEFECIHATPLGTQRLFGGQVLGQSLAAAQGLASDRPAHSFHAHFLRRGDAHTPIRLSATSIRRSRHFETIEVVARQGDEAPILQMTASFHDEEDGPVHQIPMDSVGPPQGESFEESLLRAMTPHGFDDTTDVPFQLPVEIRSVGGIGIFSKDVRPPQARCWLRVREPLPDDPALHQCLFAYASDYAIMAPALNPHPISAMEMMSASLDHAVWFHRPFRMDEWLLFELDSPVGSGARAIGRGLLYTIDGELVASCVQEGLLRSRPRPELPRNMLGGDDQSRS